MDQLLSDAKHLVHRLHVHDNAVDSLVGDATGLQGKLNAMKQYRSAVSQLNEIGGQKPKSRLILGEQLENQRIRELEQENHELQVSLAEHQSALVLIMKKYREQVVGLLKANGLDKNIFECVNAPSKDCEYVQETIEEMKAMVMAAIKVDDEADVKLRDLVHRLQCENQTLRELLNISQASSSTAKRKKVNDQPTAREQRKAKKTLSLPLASPGGTPRNKGASRLKFRSSAFSHKDASQLLFPGLSPVDKEFSPKSLGAWIKSEEAHHKPDAMDTHFDEATSTLKTTEDTADATLSKTNVGEDATPTSEENGIDDDVTNDNHGNDNVDLDDDTHERPSVETDVIPVDSATALAEALPHKRDDRVSEDSPKAISTATSPSTRSPRKKSLSLGSSDGDHIQAVVFENSTAVHDNDTIVYDISYELSGSDDDDDDDGTCYVDDIDPSQEDDDSDSNDGDDSPPPTSEESALAALDLVVNESEGEDGELNPQ